MRVSLFIIGCAFGSVAADPKQAKTASLTGIITTDPEDALDQIVGGEQAPQGAYPFFVQGNGCGASLVWADMVLTAAHCNGRFSSQVLVSAQRKGLPVNGAVYKQTLTPMMIHPQHIDGTYIYDFMMFRIEPVEGYASKIIQPNGNPASPVPGEILTIIGMGYTQESGPSSDVLNQVDVMAYSDRDCVAAYGSDIVPEAMICAGWPQGGQDSCAGDSGAPLFNSQGLQVGLTSFGSGCARPGKPATPWIAETICALSAMPPSWCSNFGQQAVSTTPAPTHSPTRAPVHPPTLPPTLPPSYVYTDQGTEVANNSTVSYRIVVQYDRFPDDVRWSVRQYGDKLVGYTFDSGVAPLGSVTEPLPLEQGYTYSLVLRDRTGDGFCCADGPGRVEIIATVDGVDHVLVSTLGDIGWFKRIWFTVPTF